ncbi:MAG: hypothetical protein NC321_07470 [Clostridium sp.]|nr:hypothetical protein [Clostridium sp.]
MENLDESGVEELLRKGDMLFKSVGYSKPACIQSAYVSKKEISDVVNFLKIKKWEMYRYRLYSGQGKDKFRESP